MTRRGMTLVECLVALVVSSVLIAAIDGALVAGRRFARLGTAARGVRQNLRAAAEVLQGELEGASPRAGDLLAISDSAVVLRAQRGFGVVCAPAAPPGVVLDDSLLTLMRSIDPTKDSALVFRDGDSFTIGDDRWIAAAVTQVRRATCAAGTPGTELTLSAADSEIAGVRPGAAVRVFEIDEYRRYRDASGSWWLGVRSPSGSGWSATSPVAGPISPRGVSLRWLGAAMNPAVVPESVALVEIAIRALDARPFAAPGHPVSPLSDSVVLRVAPGSP